jgi:imidazolonepropionase-like amidohydrolase
LIQNTDGLDIKLLQSNPNILHTAEFVYLNEERVIDGEVNFTKNKVLIVKNGKVKAVKRKKSMLQSITDLFKKDT